MPQNWAWVHSAVRQIEADFHRSADTHLNRLDIPGVPRVQLYLKDESTHPTGSLKHRLARSLFLYALCNGWIKEGTPVIEASSGSTAVSEAYFAQVLRLPFIAVMPSGTSLTKIAAIEFYGGRCYLVDDPSAIYSESRRLAKELGGHFMDQFTYAERVMDWRGNNNIAESIFAQMSHEAHPTPRWVVCGAGTGGTSATIGRYCRYLKLATQLCVVDPENSVFYDFYHTRETSLTCPTSSGVEGIGRPRVEPSFIPDVVDRMIRVPNGASYAGLWFLERILGRKCGGSTGCNFYGVCQIMAEMQQSGEAGSIVTLICDAGERYLDTYYNQEWLRQNSDDIQPYLAQLEHFYKTGEWVTPQQVQPTPSARLEHKNGAVLRQQRW
ncbi:MAG TPA: PLP-dependent cysteine synthase family protein [Caldilineaceae bacterium]|nr:PLP-dependent cysteine synthase family protein [Caldilineaceae bacterium]